MTEPKVFLTESRLSLLIAIIVTFIMFTVGAGIGLLFYLIATHFSLWIAIVIVGGAAFAWCTKRVYYGIEEY
jgi:hypothetical protein